MDTVIVAFENPAMGERFGDVLESTGTAKCLTCRSGDQVRRLLNKQQVYCVICSPHLSDGPAEWLYEDLPPSCSLLLVGPQHVLDACTGRDLFKLPTPIRKEEAVSTVRLLIQFGRRMERFVRPRRSSAEQDSGPGQETADGTQGPDRGRGPPGHSEAEHGRRPADDPGCKTGHCGAG